MGIPEYKKDKQGYEYTLSANYLGHFLLTNLLVPNLLAADEARVVNVTSHGYRVSPFRFDDWNFSDGKTYDQWTPYGQSKTAQILFAVALTKRLGARSLTSTALHPGNIFETGLATHLKLPDDFASVAEITKRNTGIDWYFEQPTQKTMTQGASTILLAALGTDLPAKSPTYLSNCQIKEPLEYATNPENAERLWKLSEELVKQRFEY
ncbi:hypothetical protein QBC46DRAFT_377550 [Diplogelasinospora grovesii]|uniref:Uncharacterized protein n=1 Tax=Diplogelasinospora grovesii TaxID=303347 RepID=A0AAN6NGK5_9PEZI|nr:hypothetical protein QBC46DRAFT_377550 [Diplogelasinospora grovesii]